MSSNRFVIRRLIQVFPTLFGVSLIAFGLMHAAPGDPLLLYCPAPTCTPAERNEIRQGLCLDRSAATQYLVWLAGDWTGRCQGRGILRGDFGRSIRQRRPVGTMIAARLAATLELMLTATLIGVTLGVVAGVASAVRRGGMVDSVTRLVSVLGNAVPAFWLGIMLILLFSVRLGWLPSSGRQTPGAVGGVLDHLRHLVLPAGVLALAWLAVVSRYMRTSTLEVLGQDYIRLAWAKGLGARQVYGRHAARNASIPLATIAGAGVASLISGAVVVEYVFAWPGMGRLAIDAVAQRDYPVLMATVIVGAVMVTLGNLVSDVLYGVLDPRVRLE